MKILIRIPVFLAVNAGLVVGAGLWALNMQLGQILPYVDCQSQIRTSLIASVVATILTAGCGITSWLTSRRMSLRSTHEPVWIFVGRLSALSAALFIFALVLQTAASMVLSGCER